MLSGAARRIALVNDTAADVRDVNVEGDSGILAVFPPSIRPRFEPSKRRVVFHTGAVATLYAAESPELLRGPQHDTAWADEMAKWKNLRKRDTEGGTAFDNLQMGLRIGDLPQCLISTTPRPLPLLRELEKRPTTVVTRGSSYENRANLSEKWFREIISPYEGTRLGRQEIEAEYLDDNPYALWRRETIEALRVFDFPELTRIAVGVDPQAASPEEAEQGAETGIIVAGCTAGPEPHAYVLADQSLRDTPNGWGRAVLAAFRAFNADRVIAEANNGGAMVEFVLTTIAQDYGVFLPVKLVHASRGKLTRAEPIAALYEQERVHHVGAFPMLEDQMCQWIPGDRSPDRMDALVWVLSELMLQPKRGGNVA